MSMITKHSQHDHAQQGKHQRGHHVTASTCQSPWDSPFKNAMYLWPPPPEKPPNEPTLNCGSFRAQNSLHLRISSWSICSTGSTKIRVTISTTMMVPTPRCWRCKIKGRHIAFEQVFLVLQLEGGCHRVAGDLLAARPDQLGGLCSKGQQKACRRQSLCLMFFGRAPPANKNSPHT